MSTAMDYDMALDGGEVHHLRRPGAAWSFCGMPWTELAPVTAVVAGSWCCIPCWNRDGMLARTPPTAARRTIRGWGDLVR